MDTLKFMKEYRRMCNYYPRCFECPRADEPNCNIEEMSDEELENFVNTVEQWSKEHPQRTRLQDLLEKFPKVEIDKEGLPFFVVLDWAMFALVRSLLVRTAGICRWRRMTNND